MEGQKNSEPKVEVSEQEESQQVHQKIIEYLKQTNAPFELFEHQKVSTSEQAALIRDTPLEWGSKTMLIRGANSAIIMLLYRANRKINWKKVRKIAEIGKKSKMISKEEMFSEFKLLPGAVPPFANILNIKGVMDSHFCEFGKMAFNSGTRNKSMVMKTDDFPVKYFDRVDISDDVEQKSKEGDVEAPVKKE